MTAPLEGGALSHDTPTRGNGALRKLSEPNYAYLPAGIRYEARTLLCVIMHGSLSTLQATTFGSFLGEIPANISQKQQTSADPLWAIYSLTPSSPFINGLITIRQVLIVHG